MSQDSNEIKYPKNYFWFSYDELLIIRNDLHMDDIKSALNKINDAIRAIEEKLPSKEKQE